MGTPGKSLLNSEKAQRRKRRRKKAEDRRQRGCCRPRGRRKLVKSLFFEKEIVFYGFIQYSIN
jgi:hypothetical protein